MSEDRLVVVFAGGDAVPPEVADHLPRDAYVIAADSGLDHARALGWPVDLVVGDLDSVSVAALTDARATGVAVEEHAAEKDETDLELALDAATRWGATHVTVVGGHGGRLDHLLANILLLAAPAYASVVVDAYPGLARIHVVHSSRLVPARAGELCTLLAMHGPAEGVRTEGLRWALRDEVLQAGTSRGVSNVA